MLEEAIDLAAPAPGRKLRVVLVGFYNYQQHALRIFHPLLKQRGHEVHTIYFKNFFTYHEPSAHEEQMVVDLVARIKPDLVCMSVWSTYFQLAARLTRRIKAAVDAVTIWGGIHPQTCPEECLEYADIVCRSEGEYVLAELTDRLSLGEDFRDLKGCWVRAGNEIVRNPPRLLIPDLDVLPPADLSSDNKYYLGYNNWRDAAAWDEQAISYDIMTVRGCPFECTFCIHNYTRKVTEGLGTYIRRRSVEHVIEELRAAVAARPHLRAIAFSDDIFSPPRPWLEEFCAAYKREIRLPFTLYAFPGMVDEKRIALMRDAGLWCVTMGIQSGSERIRRECYERETSNETIIDACEILARHSIVRNLDFIGDNPYENDQDHRETVDLLSRLPKPFYFNFFSLTYFPGVDLTERALRDGFIKPNDVEHMAQNGYHLWGGALLGNRSREDLCWDVAYAMAVHAVPRAVIFRLLDAPIFRDHIYQFARMMRQLRRVARFKNRVVDALVRRPNLLYQYWADANRQETPIDVLIQPNFDNSPFSVPLEAIRQPSHSASSTSGLSTNC